VTTVQDIVTFAHQQNGVGANGQTLSAFDLASGLTWMQKTLSQWQRRRWLIWQLVDVAATATGALNYTVGTGQSFNVPRPDRIEMAYARLLSGALPIDYPLSLLNSHEDYAALPIKQLSTFPAAAFYDPGMPNGLLYVWPLPNAQWEIHMLVKQQIGNVVSLTDVLAMPPEYEEALTWTLAAKLRPSYGLPPDPTINAAMVAAMATIRVANAQIPTLDMPSGLPMPGSLGGVYPWLSGGGGGGSVFDLDQSPLAQ
jgi:hypothetical protein